ncbi:MAG: DNA topoisomerase I subunit omega, partial [Candidatus Portiera sp.]|nr:DNA topoisomerase I subunit omega [Portiera sp.]
FSKKYLPESPRYYKSRSKQAQEAHEAIRPSSVSMSVEMLPASSSIGSSERKLYHLIYTRFIASQMTDAIFHRTKIIAKAGDYELQVSGRVLEFDGFSKMSPIINKDDAILPADLKQGEELIGKDFLPQQHFTKPSARFNEASLVKELEKLSIGRPSTYSPIISTIQERGYVRLINKKFHAEKIAEIVTDRLGDSFPNLLAYDFTASMEDTLDAIADDKENWTKVLDSFYKDFVSQLEKADSDNGMKNNDAVPTEIKCSNCSREMVIRNSSTGIFLGCSGYDDKKEPCKNTINLSSVTEEVSELEEKPPVDKKECKICGSFMKDYVVDAEHQIHICDDNPDCQGSIIEEGDFSSKAPKAEEIDCDKCQDLMEMKSGRFGKYFLCRNTECENKRRVMPNGEIAPPRMIPLETEIPCAKYPESNYIIREGALGLFLAAPGFPKQRETRSPYVKDLVPYKDRLDKKFHYLMTAPQEDDEGRLFQVRYSRKNLENYVGTFNDKNRPVQQAYYRAKVWQLEEPKRAVKKIKSKTKVIKAKRSRRSVSAQAIKATKVSK